MTIRKEDAGENTVKYAKEKSAQIKFEQKNFTHSNERSKETKETK